MNQYLDTLEPTEIRELCEYDEGIGIILEHVRWVCDRFHGDATTENGRKAIKSMARKVASVKTRCDAECKAMVSKWKDQIKAVEQRGKYLCDQLDAIRDEIRQPVTDFEKNLRRMRECKEASVKPSALGHGVADVAEDIVDLSGEGPARSQIKVLDMNQIREDIMAAIVCKSAEQIVDAIVAGDVPRVRIDV